MEYVMAAASLRRRRLARALQELREQTSLSITETAKLAGFSQAKLSRIEAAQISISGDDTYELCQALGVGEDVANELVKLARHAKRRDWWHSYPDSVLGRTTSLFELEADADSKYSFTIDVVPGPLQTEAYARELIRHGFPREPDAAIAQRVEVRMARQRHIAAGALEFWAIIDEPALRRTIGGPEVMVEQIHQLLEIAGSQHVSIQVLPAEVGCHPALGAPFHIFTLADGYSCVALENLTGGIYVEDAAEVRVYREAWSKLAAMALSFERSAELLTALVAEHRSAPREPRPLRVEEERGE
ncbi:helix-turn-helix domain-containing protein [Amycolatopsis sp. H20-H5]|uniref:helix-turn-helix domain-containing protein n=1 Tax=Amycolatopsis sp. H20-H5 TaxID=3046309 RepID=UPI002DB6C495|nr:helix-turn-helix transcriptional regulator [Amycolatopsis sp. H20-H5]MEC3978792.1 helix-turn-helix transcriptional regulator [Amycolatopsis sp. H20-H5]